MEELENYISTAKIVYDKVNLICNKSIITCIRVIDSENHRSENIMFENGIKIEFPI